ncbi:MAG: ABC transporter ATP-binding protein [Alphaproteobacteria bacterium]|nr:ABC transporter ATP-binding protein [Alphaproteobacteria bacterium]
MSGDPILRARRLSKGYRLYASPRDRIVESLWRGRKKLHHEVWALTDVSLDIDRGETVGVIGRNGAGKSTFLQLVTGTVQPTSGTIEVHGRIAALLELGAGFNPDFTGRENIHLNAALLGLTPKQIAERYTSIVAFAELGEHIERPVRTYSSGMYMRLAFAVAAHVDADLLIVDEALSVGDAFFAQKCMRFLRRFQETGSILFVSHDTAAVLGFCDRVVWLDQGRVRAIGPAKPVVEDYLADAAKAAQGDAESGNRVRRMTIDESGRSATTVDGRLAFINASPHRNDLELFAFRPDAASFGRGQAEIVGVRMETEDGNPFSWCVGGEMVTLAIDILGHAAISRPIVGFLVKDRLGQHLFGDNTYLSHEGDAVPIAPGERLRARFRFRMPILAIGTYTVAVAIADGNVTDHIQHHWIHDALAFTSHASSAATGLVGVPMHEISLERTVG